MSHYRRTRISRCVEALDHRAVVAQGTAVDVGADTALRAEITRHHLGCVVWRVADLAEVGVGFVRRIAVVAVVGTLAAPEVLVRSRSGESVEALDRGGEGLG